MCLFKKWRKRKADKKKAKNKEATKKQGIKNEEINTPKKTQKEKVNDKETVEKLKIRPFSKPKVSNHEANEWPKETVKKVKPKPRTTKSTSKKYSGKYEVYPEAGNYKFRLKASNGEILVVSFRYSTEKGAISGIDTFKKNVEEGIFEVTIDKSNFSQFQLFNASGARVIVAGEIYQSLQKANSAIESVKSFYDTNKIEILDKIPKSEVREELIKFEKVEEAPTGKYELYKEKDNYYVRLKASNSQILFISQGYASKASAKNGLKTIQKAIADKNFTIARDKQNRYQFNLYSSNGQLLVSGETYPVKSSGISAVHSVLKFGLKAKLADLS
ncbi:MAG: DUF1508 domain-containing protein [Candidatus Izimaplasma sp.]|nr:DUF1508 domain-containing protein [Candidatus Izimaplasma bacterium]